MIALAIFLAHNFALGLISVLWAIGLLVCFHGFLWRLRGTTTQNQLKGLEYIYLLLGLSGALGFIEVQGTLQQERVRQYVAHYPLSILPGPNCTWPPSRLSELFNGPSKSKIVSCQLENQYLLETKSYDHRRLAEFLQKFQLDASSVGRFENEQHIQNRIEFLTELWSEVQGQFYDGYFDTKGVSWLTGRMAGFYILLIAIAIKIAKTTAEIRRWYV